ncbi:hypothetical protein SAMN05216241_107123 [Limimonas halophila]|uniref:Nuclease homologue n=2 Tax=Limimonas halophila TaxID=1082479 RepID=A0A1G7SRM6_9PROT|nr:hypothetical protein SAMN05216241_107123 [Limimonas halophila]
MAVTYRGLAVAAAMAVSVGLAGQVADAAALTGKARVTDGDTVVVGGKDIRLQGVDAPETESCATTEKT